MRFHPTSNRDGYDRPAGSRLRRGVGGVGVALLTAVAVAACGGSSNSNTTKNTTNNNKSYGTVITGDLPAQGSATHGGTISVGQLTGQTPTDIFPMIDGQSCSTQTFYFVANQYIPLYYGPEGAKPAIDQSLSAAQMPKYTNGDKTVTITLKPGLKWSDGKPVTAQDVLFYLDLLKAAVKESPANWCQYAGPTEFPGNVTSWTAKGNNTVVMQLTHAVNPNWFTTNQLQDTNGGVYPMPSQDWNIAAPGGPHITDWATNPADAKKIYDYLHKQGEAIASFASNPLWKVVDGPFKLKDYSATNNSYDLVPNAKYGLTPKPYASDIAVQTYTSNTAMLNALESGSLEIGTLDPSQLGSLPTLKRDGYSTFGGPGWGWFGGFINFKDTTNDFNKIVAQSYIRGVFAELVDQQAILKGVYKNWAVPAYGPVPTAPYSPYIPADATKSPWPYNPSKAVATLKAHGWAVKPGGQTTCAKPGTAANECGAGIPKGTPIKFVWANLPKNVSSVGELESSAFAGEAKKAAGITVTLVSKTFNFLTSNYNNQNPAAAKYVNDWGVNNYGGIYTDYYPTQDGVMTPTGALNMGSYNDPKATALMHASTTSPSVKAIANEVSYFAKQYPVFYMPDQDWITSVSKKVGGTQNGFLTMTQQNYAFQFLWVNKK